MSVLYEKDSSDVFYLDDYVKEDIINKLSDDILIQNITDQISKKMEDSLVKNNILEIFNTRYNYIIDSYKDYQDIIDSCKQKKNEMYDDIVTKISDKFDFRTNIENIYNTEDYYLYIEALYSFFIINHKENLTKLIINYILNNKKEIINEVSSNIDKGDILFKSLKSSYTNINDVYILYSLNEIILNILNKLTDYPLRILEYIIKDDEYKFDNKIIYDIFIIEENEVDADIGTDFSSIFLSPLRIDKYKINIISDIRVSLSDLFLGNQ